MNEALTPRDDIVPIESPAVWLGRDMAARNDWMYPLSRADISELEEAIARVRTRGLEMLELQREFQA